MFEKIHQIRLLLLKNNTGGIWPLSNKHICIIASGYPTKDDPFFSFVRPVVSEMADMGYKCTFKKEETKR